jgi:RNA polymerase-binding transcription factor DksA
VADQTLQATLRATLEQERDHLRHTVDALEAGNDASMDFDENFADSGQVAAEQGEAKILSSSLREQLLEVERALAKMDDGSYGRCERCGQPIAEPRLEAMPATAYCIDHA